MNFKTIALGFVATLGFALNDAQAQNIQPDSLLSSPKNGFAITDIEQKPNPTDKSVLFPRYVISYRTADKRKHATLMGSDTNNDNILSKDEIINTAYAFYNYDLKAGFGATVSEQRAFYYLINEKKEIVNQYTHVTEPVVVKKIKRNIMDALFYTPPENETDLELNPFHF